MSIINYSELSKIRERHKDDIIVFCHGTFDLTHAGHALLLKGAKEQGDVLVVTVTNDAAVRHIKGKERPILNEVIRLDMVDSLKPVDYCFLDVATDTNNSLIILEEIFDSLKPDIYIINEDTLDIPYRKKLAKKRGIKMKVFERWSKPEYENISTTKIIEKIKSLSAA
jgi:cytidyltransferase-like protein